MPSNASVFFDAGAVQRTKPDPSAIKPVYFPLCLVDAHRDARYCKDLSVPIFKRQRLLVHCLQAFAQFADEHQLPYWVIHGGLIGWYWNEFLLPWDMDVDVSVLYADLAQRYQPLHGTVFRGRYLFEVNPNAVYRQPQRSDVIDARFIDRLSGLYIDLTAVSYDAARRGLHCKTPHYYAPDELFPLRRANFSGAEVWVPHRALDILAREYPHYEDRVFHRGKRLFEVKFGETLYEFDEAAQRWRRQAPSA